ncbi:hypothetical protein VNO80_09574 [Phaseolus coccineus]|uniref:Uncharacterized protein n=1 Tax=Phaseolus coccineus TaxID=3886 RepID=A0AAN9N6F0_PHACN
MELVGSMQKNPLLLLILCNSLKHQFQEFTKQHADDSRGYSGSTFQRVAPSLFFFLRCMMIKEDLKTLILDLSYSRRKWRGGVGLGKDWDPVEI